MDQEYMDESILENHSILKALKNYENEEKKEKIREGNEFEVMVSLENSDQILEGMMD